MQEVFIEQKRPSAIFDSGTKSVTVVDNAGYTTIQTIRLRPGFDTVIAIGFDVAPGSEAFASFRVLVNGNPWTDDLYNSITSQPGSTNNPEGLIQNFRPVPEGALLQIQGRLVSAGANYLMYSRARVEYRDKN